MALRKNNSKANLSEDSPFSFSSSGQAPLGAPVEAPGEQESLAEAAKAPAKRGKKRHKSAEDVPGIDSAPMYGEAQDYANMMGKRSKLDHRAKFMVAILIIAVVLIPLTLILPVGWLEPEEFSKGLPNWIEHFNGRIAALGLWIQGSVDGESMGIVFWQTAALFFVGAALALNGAVFQGAMNNALASPSTLGVISGGTLGSVIYTMLYLVPTDDDGDMVSYASASDLLSYYQSLDPFQYFFAVQGRALFSLIGCLAIVGLVLVVARIAGRGKTSKVALVIAGQVFASLTTGVVSIIHYYILYNGTEQQLIAIQSVAGGSVTDISSLLDFCLIAVPVLIGIIIIFAMRFKLNLLAFNADEAKSMGLDSERTRNIVVAICTILTAVVVSFCGSVGFVGFLIPHLARRIVGPDFRYLIPTSMFLGSAYLLLCNHIMQLTGAMSGSLGTFTSLVGIVFFMVVAVRQRARGNVDWI